jgi:invasion protein IalB
MNGFPRLIAAAAIAISAYPPAADAVDGPARTQTAQAPTGRSTPRAPAAAPAAAQPAAPAAPAPAAQPAGGQPASAPAPPPIPTRTEILNFENWVVTCNEFAEGPKTRACSALLQIVQQNTNQIVFAWTIGFDNAKQIVTVMQTPTGVNIPPGIELRVGKVPPHKIPFASCDAGRCVATSPMDATLLREMTTVPTAEAIVQGSQGNTVQFTIQMKGFDKAFAALSRS